MTRKDGIYLLNLESRTVLTYFDRYKIKALNNHGDFIFATTETGELFQFNDTLKKFIDIPPTSVGKYLIYDFLPLNSDEILLSANFGILRLHSSGRNSFKVEPLSWFISHKVSDLATNDKNDLFICSTYSPFVVRNLKLNNSNVPKVLHRDLAEIRSFAVYSKSSDETYVANINGLNLVTKDRLIKLWETDPDLKVRILNIEGINDSTELICTDGYGLIVLCNNKVIQKLGTETGLASPFCKKAIRNNNKLYVCTNNGLSIFYIDKNSLTFNKTISTENGISSNDIRDIVLKDNKLYIATDKGISIIRNNSNTEQRKDSAPEIYFNSVFNNQKMIDFNKKFFIPNDQRNLVVNFTALTFDHPEEVLYQYKFNSGGNNWISTTLNEINFSQLEPGAYELQIRGRKQTSNWSKPLYLNFVVQKPFYLETWFLITCSLFIFGSASIVFIYLNRRGQRHKIFELEKASLLNAERARISADMHDDLGSDLSKIGLLSYVVKTKYSLNQNIDDSLNKIYDTVNSTRKKADDIIWALNPQLDTSGDLLAFLTDYCLNFFEGSNIAISINKTGIKTEVPIRSRIRRDVFLITKEICNNVYKHSQAGKLDIVMKIDNEKLILEFKDDGIGFSSDENNNGNGLINIKRRVKEVNGIFEVISSQGNGVTYVLIIPIM
jgi:signal transduction histidine kinase